MYSCNYRVGGLKLPSTTHCIIDNTWGVRKRYDTQCGERYDPSLPVLLFKC